MPDNDVNSLLAVGHSLFGGAWRRPLADALAPYNPRGKRAISASYLGHMQTGRRPVPAWVRNALPQILSADIASKATLHSQISAS